MNKKGNYLKQAWLVLLLSVFFGASLAFVQVALSEKINQNKLAETVSQIPSLVPGADSGIQTSINNIEVYKAMKGEKQLGWIIPSKGMGFADKIEILVGLNIDASKITGLYVLDQKETPGLGNKIIEDTFRMQFKNKLTANKLEAVKSKNTKEYEITAVTGATISSVSVCDIVNSNLQNFKNKLNNSKKV